MRKVFRSRHILNVPGDCGQWVKGPQNAAFYRDGKMKPKRLRELRDLLENKLFADSQHFFEWKSRQVD